MTPQDSFLAEIRHAAGQVGPVAGIDGAAMARRAVRRGQARRAGLTAVGVVAAVGVLGGSWAVLAPGTRPALVVPAAGGTPDGWVPVAAGGLALAVPPELEWRTDGVWEVEGPAPGEGDESFVQVSTVGDDDHLVPAGSDLTPVDVAVPGAESAAYVVEVSDDPTVVQDFVGRLQVDLGSGEVVQVVLVWLEAAEGKDVFADLVSSVSVDPDGSALLPDADAVLAPEPLDVTPGVPDGWREAEHSGLTYAVPPRWVDDEAAGGEFPAGSTSRATSVDRSASLTVVRVDDPSGWPDGIAPSPQDPASTFPVEGADVVQVTTRTEDDTHVTTVHVRSTRGAGYIVDVAVPDTVDGRAQALRLVGTLGLDPGAPVVTGPDDLLEHPTTATPADWVPQRWEDLRLAVPPGWQTATTPGGAGWALGAAAAGPEESIAVDSTEIGDGPGWGLPPYGFRAEVAGADHAVVQVGEMTDADGRRRFLGQVRIVRGDHAVTVEFLGGMESVERFGMLVDSLELIDR